MRLASVSEEKYRKYWLNELPASEQEALEEQYFMDADALEAALAAKQALTDDYAHQRLSAPQQQWFEKSVLVSPLSQFDVRLLQTLRAKEAYAAAPVRAIAPPPKPAFWQRLFAPASGGMWGKLAFATVALAFCASLVRWQMLAPKPVHTGAPAAQVATSTEPAHGSQEFLLALSPEAEGATTRGGKELAPQVAPAWLGREIGFLQLRLALPAVVAAPYRFEIQDLVSKKIVWQDTQVLAARQREAQLRFAREALPTGDYRLSLFKAGQDVALKSYRFDVRAQAFIH